MPKKLPLCFALLLAICVYASGQTVDSLNNALEDAEGEQRIELLHALIVKIWNNYPDQALEYGQEALRLSRQAKNQTYISQSLRLIAGIHYYRSEFDVSLDYILQALNIGLQLGDSSLINKGYNHIGLIYYDLGSHQTALEYLLRSSRIKVSMGEMYELPMTLNNIGLIFSRISELDVARQNFNDALQIARSTNNKNAIAYSFNCLGISFLKESDLGMARQYFDSALVNARAVDNMVWESISFRNIGEIFRQQGVQDSAKIYFNNSLKISDMVDDKKGLAEVYYFMAKLAIDQKNVSQATEFLDKSMALASALKIRYQILENLRLYVDIHMLERDNEKVIQKQLRYVDLQDSLFRDVVGKNLLMVPIKLKEEADRIRLSEQRVELAKKNQANQIYLIVLVFSIVIFVVLVYLLNRNKKTNRQLVENNAELLKTQSLLIRTEKMASLGVLAAGVGHEINNPLNYIKNGVITLSQKISKEYPGTRDDLSQYFDIIEEGVDRASNIVKSLGHFSRTETTYDQECNVQDIIENCLTILGNKIRKGVDVERKYAKNTPLVIGNEGKLHQLFLNVISNAEQAIDRVGQIIVRTRKEGEYCVIQIKDDGMGIPEENLLRITDPFYTTKPPGEGTGLGLFVVYSIVDEHNGDIGVESVVGVGTEFTIKLPINAN